jgi:tRNA pseudouridine32 synthase / 23S rRNA pseudouridine746 synthase
MRDGVSASRVAVPAGSWVRVLDFLQTRMPMVADWPQRLQRGEVLYAQGLPVPPDAPATPGTVLWYWRQPPPEPRVPFEVGVLHQDEHLVIADKPHFLPVTPGGQHLHETVLVRLKRQLGISTLVPMHRLDRETAGVIAFVVRPEERNAYQGLLREQRVHKVYEAVAPWRADVALPQVYSSRLQAQEGDDFMQMLTVKGEPNAHTHIELVSRWRVPSPDTAHSSHTPASAHTALGSAQPTTLAHYRLTPRTGRKHQLRVHLCALGLPIVGDRIYPHLWPPTPPGEPPDFRQPLQLLARELAFTDPVTGQARCFRSQRRLQCVPGETGGADEKGGADESAARKNAA